MIRRTPTMIPMTDLDVQDVRDMVAKQKAEAQKSHSLMLKLKRMSENPNMTEEDKQMFMEITSGLSAIKESRAKRLGLEPGQRCYISHCWSYNDASRLNRVIAGVIVQFEYNANIAQF